jgi:hypothetical protein
VLDERLLDGVVIGAGGGGGGRGGRGRVGGEMAVVVGVELDDAIAVEEAVTDKSSSTTPNTFKIESLRALAAAELRFKALS